MYLQALANHVPKHTCTQAECWEILKQSPATSGLSTRSWQILEKVLTGNNGIGKRHFAVEDLASLFDSDATILNQTFEKHAPALATKALRDALEQARLKPGDLDALYICTCTGYLCPGLTSYVAEHLGLPAGTYLHDTVGHGCGAAIPTLRSAHYHIASQPDARVAVIAVEICSAAFYLDNDPGVLISLCLFGDGASASIWSGQPGPTALRTSTFDTHHLPEDRNLLRFENRNGKLRNILHRSVPEKAAAAVHRLFTRTPPQPHTHILAHAGGRDVIDALAQALPGHPLDESARVLHQHGNMSSPSVLFALGEYLKTHPAPTQAESLWLTTFGAGFAAHSMRLERA